MNLVRKLLERLRPIVNFKSWDYCIIWQLAEDQRFLEWMDCCCAGSENMQNGGEDLFTVSSVTHCRDAMFQHPRTKPCDLLAEFPPSIPLDSGIYAQALMSNQARWLNFSANNSDSNPLEETVGTRVLIPVPIGLVELFVAKQVPEDQEIIDYISSQCTILLEQQSMINSSNMDPNFSMSENNQIDLTNNPFLPSPENSNLPYDITADRIQLNSPMNFAQPSFFDGSNCNGFLEMDSIAKPMTVGSSSCVNKETDKDSGRHDMGRSESISDCSDANEDEDDAKYRRRTGKGPQSKNLQAERKRRKKLNDRLYTLRSLVPIITKLDRASILGDAIEFVKELLKQVSDLQLELEEQSGDDEGTKNNGRSEILNAGLKREHENTLVGGNNMGAASYGSVAEPTNRKHDSDAYDHKSRQMEPQVEVAQIDENEFFVKVFCEHKSGGFVRLMEALNSLGLEVTNVNVTSCRSLVSNVFQVKKMDSEMVQADYVRDSLLEITRFGGWPDQVAKTSKNDQDGMDCHHHDHRGGGDHPNGLHNHQTSSHNLHQLHR
ncbi:transcription factor ABORTED MICROSPORES-like isoform X1 [Rhododendron vialii]|uniref:transcription factor ABORTED MICROSPORES-like isoform X1 n=2 Tax=Rhododendron vialii TaxID=182163 RepID=UPI00265EAE89|nr:transcription factor ABORTED MICROSPORES-like isoform X1 [Rhododendron vialii]XP_058215983.1 transcription factor ABORTED MICROSPORES-like isoform X1 [Rhododendron vialii]XP_058215984.1 transcription factor ABORTED MICROSPORES-like isoform X1 [Rhododendron vialii]